MKKKTIRWFYMSLGLTCTGVGLVGVFLPILPTTPFLLVAVWAFSRSSLRLRNWLYHHPRFGSSIRDWFEHGEISLRVKIISITAMGLSIPTFYFITGSLIALVIYLLVILSTAIFIATRPSRKKPSTSKPFTKNASRAGSLPSATV